MLKQRIAAVFLTVVCLLHSQNANAESSSSNVRERAEALVSLMRTLPSKPAEATQTGKLDTFFNFDALTRAPLAPYEKNLKSQERRKIASVFGRLVRHLAYASGDSMRRGEVSVAEASRPISDARQATDVRISNPDEDVDNQVSFVWEKHQGVWLVVDVELDGASVVKDYENQFGKIIKKDGPDGLLKRMQSRLAQAERREPDSAKKP